MPRRLHTVRVAAACALTAALAAGTLAAAGGATADSTFVPLVDDLSLSPGDSSWVTSGALGTADGTAVYVFSKQPLTDSTWAGGGLPAGLTASVTDTSCKPYAGVPGVYTCPVTDDNLLDSPTVTATADAANHTVAYVGAAYAPRGGSLTTAIRAAELAGTTSTPDTQTAAVISVLTREEVAKSTVRLTTPDVPLGSSSVHTLQVHAADPAKLLVNFGPSTDERWMDQDEVDVEIASVDGGPAGACSHSIGSAALLGDVSCELPAGDYTITYTLAAGPKVQAWKLVADAVLNVVDSGRDQPEATSTFKVLSPYPVSERYRLFGRSAIGQLWSYDSTGTIGHLGDRQPTDDGWQQYTAATALSAVTQHGTGDVVARDKSGVLWGYPGSGSLFGGVFKPRTRVGAGWNTYNTLVGARDLTGDGRADLVARDASGVLWLYRSTSGTTVSFAARTRIGGGWNTYKTLVGAGDLTGDGRADLLATDASGVMWLYKGTGNAAAPYDAARVKAGTGWSSYNILLSPGDLTGDGRTDLVARDASGVLWLYKGTGNATIPVQAPRIRIGTGWNTYNLMF